MSRILIDATVISGRGKGLSRYAVNLLRGLGRVGGEHEYTVLVDASETLPELPSAANFRYLPVRARPRMKWLFRVLPKLLRETRVDLLHIVGELGPLWIPLPLVLTLTELPARRHALQSRRSARERFGNGLYEFLFPICVRSADRLVSISTATRTDVVEALQLDPARVRVTALAAEEQFFREPSPDELEGFRARIDAREGFALAFSTGDGRERLEFLLDMWARVVPRLERPIRLVLAGARDPSVRSRINDLARELGIGTTVLVLGYVDDADLPLLYAAADCYVDTSIYEGFGLQSLEAMASGTQVVASNIPAIAEVVGPAGVLVDPANAGDFANAVEAALLGEDEPDRGREIRCARAREFTWDDAALGTLRTYAEVIEAKVREGENA